MTAEHSWAIEFAILSFHMVCCSSATRRSPNWTQHKGQTQRLLRMFKISKCFKLCYITSFYSWCHKYDAYMGGGQGFWLQFLMSPRGFMLDLLQKLLWTILLSTFLLQPYRRYCFPTVREDEKLNKCKSRIKGKGSQDAHRRSQRPSQ